MVRRNGVTLTELVIVISIIAIIVLTAYTILTGNCANSPEEAASRPPLSMSELANFAHLTKIDDFSGKEMLVKFETNHKRGGQYQTPTYEWVHVDAEAYAYLKSHEGEMAQTVFGYYRVEKERQKKTSGASEK